MISVLVVKEVNEISVGDYIVVLTAEGMPLSYARVHMVTRGSQPYIATAAGAGYLRADMQLPVLTPVQL